MFLYFPKTGMIYKLAKFWSCPGIFCQIALYTTFSVIFPKKNFSPLSRSGVGEAHIIDSQFGKSWAPSKTKLKRRESVVGLDDGLRGVDVRRSAPRRGGQRREGGSEGAYVHSGVGVQHSGVVEIGRSHGVRVRMSRDGRRNLVRRKGHIEHILPQSIHFPAAAAAATRVVVFPFIIVIGRSAVCCFPPDFGRFRRVWRGRRRDPGGIRFSPYVFRVGQFVIFLPLHPSVLEPDFNLSFWEDQRVCYFDSSSARQIPIVMELFLQLQDLVAGVSGSLSFRFHSGGETPVCCNNNIDFLCSVCFVIKNALLNRINTM